MKFRVMIFGAVGTAAALGACGGSTSTVATASSALETAQCTYNGFHQSVDACFASFDACRTAENANVDECEATLRTCLPPPPPNGGPGGHGGCMGNGDGGMGPPGGGRGGPGGHGSDGHHGGPSSGGRGGHGIPGAMPDPAAVQACHDALTACQTATPGDASCQAAERDCVHAAFDAAFQAACTAAQQNCTSTSTDPDCGRLLERCTQGVAGNPDGGGC